MSGPAPPSGSRRVVPACGRLASRRLRWGRRRPRLAVPPVAAPCSRGVAGGALAAQRAAGLALAGVALALPALVGIAPRRRARPSVLGGHLGEPAPARVVVTGPADRRRSPSVCPRKCAASAATRFRERVPSSCRRSGRRRRAPSSSCARGRSRRVGPRPASTSAGGSPAAASRSCCAASGARIVGRRGGIGGVADRLRAHVERTLASGTPASAGSSSPESSSARTRASTRRCGMRSRTAALCTCWPSRARTWRSSRSASSPSRGSSASDASSARRAAIVVVLAYALAVGWQPSVVRAAVAGVLASLAWIVARPRDRWHALAVGALVLLAWKPASALEPGFQLSFAAVAAIFVVLPRVSGVPDAYPVPRGLWDVVAVAVACGCVTAPIVWLHFGAVALWTVPANVAAEPAMPPLIGLSLAAAAIEPVLPGAAAALAWLAGWCAAWIALVARVVSGWPSRRRRVAGRLLAALVVAALAVVGDPSAAALPASHRDGRARLGRSASRPSACAFRPRPTWTPPDGLRITFLDVGQGDAVLVETAGGAVLVDQGPPEADVAGQLRAPASVADGARPDAPAAGPHRRRGRGDPEAAGRRRSSIRSSPSAVAEYDAPPGPRGATTSPSSRRARRRLPARPCGRPRPVARGRGPAGEDPNLNAVVLLVSFGATDVLLTADAESPVTSRLRLGPVEVLKVAHHGSEDPGSPISCNGCARASPSSRSARATTTSTPARDARRARGRAGSHDVADGPRRPDRGRVRRAHDHRPLGAMSAGWSNVTACRPEARVPHRRGTTVRRWRGARPAPRASIRARSSGSWRRRRRLRRRRRRRCNAGSLLPERAPRARHRGRRTTRRVGPPERRLEGGRHGDRRRLYLRAPAPGTVLCLVGEELKRDSPLAKACEKVGDVLVYEVGSRTSTAGSRGGSASTGSRSDGDACRGAARDRRRREAPPRPRDRQARDVGRRRAARRRGGAAARGPRPARRRPGR